MAKKRKARKINPRKLNFKRLAICAGVLAVAALGIKTVHFFGDEETKDTIESGIVSVIDIVRECPATPDEMVFLLDGIAQHLPFVYGQSVDAGTLDATGFVLGGSPESKTSLNFLKNRGYIVGYDNAAGNPAWVAYKVFPPKSFETEDRPAFETDTRSRARVEPSDYTRSGYDRGHMAPNQAMGGCYGEAAQRESFLMTNIVPQLHEVNAGVWKDLEQRILKRYTHAFGEVWVLCGPIYNKEKNQRKLKGKVVVPDAFFMIVADRDEERRNALRTLGFIIPHEKGIDGNARAHLASIREIERRSGLNFFRELDEITQNALELKPAKTIW